MPVIVTLDMYSGRPNPSWVLPDAEVPVFEQLVNRPREVSPLSSPGSTGMLGYRGLIVTHTGAGHPTRTFRAFDGILEAPDLDTPNYVDRDSELEAYLLGQAGAALSDDERQYIAHELEKNVAGGAANSARHRALTAVPPFNPGKWNDSETVLRNNNCYNYANDLITNTFAQPGRGTGQEGPYPPNCADTAAAAVRDGLVRLPGPDITPADGQVVALVVATTPGFYDYHWYRRDSNGMWSHKPGQTAARNTDNAGQPIHDPRECDRGPYNNFCGFFNAIPARSRIQ